MRFTAERTPLLAALSHSVGAVGAGAVAPILAHVLIEAEADSLSVTGCNLDLELCATLSASVETPAKATIDARQFQEVVRAAPAGCEISFSNERGRATIAYGATRFCLPTLAPDTFPVMRQSEAPPVRLLAADLLRSLERVTFATCRDESKPILTGAFLLAQGSKLLAVATNRHQAAVDSSAPCDGDAPGTILSRPFIEHARKVLSANKGGDCTLIMDGDRATILAGNLRLSGRAIEGPYIEHERMVPKGHEYSVTAERAPLVSALRRAAIVATNKDRSVRLYLREDRIDVSAFDAIAGEATDTAPASLSGPERRITINGKNFVEVLDHAEGDHVRISYGEHTLKPIIITGSALGVLFLQDLQRDAA